MSEAITIGGREIEPGSIQTINLPLPDLYTNTPTAMPVHVMRGKRDGPRLFVTAAIHGDELNGIEIVRRLARLKVLKKLRGTLIAIPIVNVLGCIQRSRYLPDGRDLNRFFPGSPAGSLAARQAHQVMQEIVAPSDFGIDLHTGAGERANLPQVRADLDQEGVEDMAQSFGAPVILHSDLRDGSLREAAREEGVKMLLFEAGEALRFDEVSIRTGVRGVLGVLRHVGMLPKLKPSKRERTPPLVAGRSSWQRAPASGILRARADLGKAVTEGEVLGLIADPFGDKEQVVESRWDGIIIGRTRLPLVLEGDALFHIARATGGRRAAMEDFEDLHDLEKPNRLGEPPLV